MSLLGLGFKLEGVLVLNAVFQLLFVAIIAFLHETFRIPLESAEGLLKKEVRHESLEKFLVVEQDEAFVDEEEADHVLFNQRFLFLGLFLHQLKQFSELHQVGAVVVQELLNEASAA